MKKTRKTIAIVSVVILLIVSLTLTLTSCALGGYKLTFDVDGVIVKTIDVPSGGTLELPDTPIKVGYTFGGWYFDKETLSDPCTAETLKGKKFKGDTVAYAKWLKNDYNITYNLDGGINAKANPSGYVVDTATITLAPPTKLGYTFGGWFEDDKFTKVITEIATGSTGDMTLFAKWTKDNYTITYNLDGGENEKANPTTYAVDTATITLADPTRVGYTFGGWFGEDTFTTKVTEIATGSAGNMTLFAKWTAIEYNIIYNLNEGVLTGAYPTTYTIDKDTTLATPTRNGYTFGGWCEKADLTDTAIKAIAKGTTSVKTLYAKWLKNDYTITYDLNGGENAKANPSGYVVDTATITLVNPFKLGYTFDGWYSEDTFTTKVTEIAKGSTGNMTLFAKWLKNDYSIIYKNLEGATNNALNPGGYDIDTTTITLADPTKAGYTFDGWYSEDAFTTKVTEIAKGSTGDKTLYAKWALVTYIITYVGADGVGALNPNTFTNYTFESNTIHIAPASWKEGAEFIGWSIDGNVANATTTRTIPKGSVGNVTLTAHWTFTQYAITYELDGGTNYYNHPSTYNIDTATITLNDPTHEESEATFVGWYKSATGNDKITTIDRGTTGDLTIYARWDYYATPGLVFTPINNNTEYEVSKGTVDSGVVTVPRRHDNKLVTRIASFGFEKIGIANIRIPNGVKSIGDSAFWYCRSLRDVTIPESVTSIERSAFSACAALQHAFLPSNLKIIPDSMFSFCYVLWYVRMPLNVETISAGAFQDCRLLESMNIPDSVTSIWGSAFAGCKILPSIFIPKSVTTIASSAFDRCFALRISCEIAETAVPVPDNPLTTGWHAKWMGVTDPVTSDRISWSQTRPTPTP